MIDKLSVHIENRLPFVVYRKPNATNVKAVLQKTDKLHTVSDFTESGFVMAPFDHTREAILLPFDVVFMGNLDDFPTAEMSSQTANPSAEAKKEHLQLVANAVHQIQNSVVEKIVVSRKEEIISDTEPLVLFRRLCEAYPTAFVYLWFHPKVGMWIGATPETLVHSRGKTMTTMSLAGTRKFEENTEVAWSSKEIEEQQIVTEYILDRLKEVTTQVSVDKAETHRAGSLLHLRSVIIARMKPSTTIGDVLKTLHPTPAICGYPMEMAKQFILQEEHYDRAFYTGYLGELNIQEEIARNRNQKNQENSAYRTIRTHSELYVNLRCMQLIHTKRILYIGGGITKDSNPESEWQETVAKSQIMKRVL